MASFVLIFQDSRHAQATHLRLHDNAPVRWGQLRELLSWLWRTLVRRWRSRPTSPAASWGSLPNLCTSWTRWRTREDVMSWIFEWWRTKVRVCSWQSSKVVEQSYSWLLTRSRNPRARDSNISRFELVVKLDYMIQSLDCKLLKYKLAFVVFLWPWSVLQHYIKQCTQIISNCYMGTILFTYRV